MSIVLLTPVLVFVCLAAFQASMWNHDRAQARASARTAAAAVARGAVSASDATTDAVATLTANTNLAGITAQVVTSGGQVIVTIAATAPGILVGTHSPISVTVALSTEGWTAL